jgi:hypothetical protein
MTERGIGTSADPYSPRRRTALVLTGVGTAGAYHAGVLRAFHEAGVKLDVVAGRGIGVVGALFAAVDGSERLWGEKGFWRSREVRRFYGWRPALRLIVCALVLSIGLVLVPIAAVAAGLVVFPIDFLLKIVGIEAAGGLVTRYTSFAQAAFASAALPTWLPRLVLILMMLVAISLMVAARLNSDERGRRDHFWWRALGAPMSASSIVLHCWRVMWDLVRGAAPLGQPVPSELGRRYVEMLSDNLGQPGFRELVILVHDVDAHRDLVFTLVGAARRRDLVRGASNQETEARGGIVQDLGGLAANHLTDAVAGALAIPLMTEYRTIQFAPDSYWRGESHRIADRPSGLVGLLEELALLEVAQVLLVSASPESPGPHALTRVPLSARGRLSEFLESSESAAVRDVLRTYEGGIPRVFAIRPSHNPIGPLDFAGAFDDRSDRWQPLGELINRGYEDAYRQFIEPVLGASGERVGQNNSKLKT